MTKEEANKAIEEYLAGFLTGDLIITIASAGFPASEVGAALGVPLDDILLEHSKRLINELSAYKAVLQNALKGQLTVPEEKWEEILDN
jgi:hypothetical protein